LTTLTESAYKQLTKENIMDAATIRKRISKTEELSDKAYSVYSYERQKREWGHPNTERETYKEWMALVSVRTALRDLHTAQHALDYELKRTKLKL
jgi:hypothetical protein